MIDEPRWMSHLIWARAGMYQGFFSSLEQIGVESVYQKTQPTEAVHLGRSFES